MAQALKLRKTGLRPTLSKVRQAIFNIIARRVEGSVFMDLYAGTGAIGMEAMSRGAREVYFVESDRKTAGILRDLLEGCGCRPKAHILPVKADAFLKRAGKEGVRADIVFLDPPYASGELEKILPRITSEKVLAEGAVVIAEHSSKVSLPEETGILRKKKVYKYGDTSLTLYVAMEREEGEQ
ncbi:MAG: 16S rRNA (guanine(966)-N(2))-methyltransferase RsmD [Nitrospiraceae bacterium]|nr:16S rRNA (guanine(966)-N(2))-methyltransferase RsmD [Nitrospiraceae bacterium]